MAFPFLPGGAILAAAVLIGALTAFGVLLRAMDRAIGGVRGTAIPGMVAGFRAWGARTPGGQTSEPTLVASPWSLQGTESRPARSDRTPAAPAVPAGEWPTDDPSAEIVDLGTRRIDPRESSRS